MTKKIAIALASLAGVLAMLVPISARAAVPAECVVVNGPNGVHLQLGYAPHGPSDCRTLP
jgi:hypothetical protein